MQQKIVGRFSIVIHVPSCFVFFWNKVEGVMMLLDKVAFFQIANSIPPPRVFRVYRGLYCPVIWEITASEYTDPY